MGVRKVSPPGRRPGSRSFPEADEIISFFSKQKNQKQEILEGFLHFAGRHFETAGIFAVQEDELIPLCGIGNNLKIVGKGAKSAIDFTECSIARRTISKELPFCGPVPSSEVDNNFFLGFLHNIPEQCWLYPVAIGDVIDCLIYAERPKGMLGKSTKQLEFLIEKLVLSLRWMWMQQLMSEAMMRRNSVTHLGSRKPHMPVHITSVELNVDDSLLPEE